MSTSITSSNVDPSGTLTENTDGTNQIPNSEETVSAIDANIPVAESLPSIESLTANENIAPSECIISDENITTANEDETISNVPEAKNPLDSLPEQEPKDDDKKMEMVDDEVIHIDTDQTSTAPNNDDDDHNDDDDNNDDNNTNNDNKAGTPESSDLIFVDASSNAPLESSNIEGDTTAEGEMCSSEVSVAATSVSVQEEGEVVRLKKHRPKKPSSDPNHHHRHRNHHHPHHHQHLHQHHSRHHSLHRHNKRPTHKHHSNLRHSHGMIKKETILNTDSNHMKSSPKRIDNSNSNRMRSLKKEDTFESVRSLISPLMVNNPEFSSNNFLATQSKPLMTVSISPPCSQTVQPNNNNNNNNNNNDTKSTEIRDEDKKFISTGDDMSELTIQTNNIPSLNEKVSLPSCSVTPSSPNSVNKNEPSNLTTSQNYLNSGNDKSVPVPLVHSILQDRKSVQENEIFNKYNDSGRSMHDSGPLLAIDDSEWKGITSGSRRSNENKSNEIFLQKDNSSDYEIVRDKPHVVESLNGRPSSPSTNESNTEDKSKSSSNNTNATTIGSYNQDESLNEVKRIKKQKRRVSFNKLYRSNNQRNVHDETRVKENDTNSNSFNKENVFLLESTPNITTDNVSPDFSDSKISRKKRGCIKRLLISSMCMTLLSIIIVILIIYFRKSKTSANKTIILVNMPTSTPTKFLRLSSSPTSIQYSDLAGFIRFSDITNNDKLLTPGTTQNNALEWFVNDPIQRERDKSDKRFLQRFVLGVFYFSLSEESIYGNGWHMCSKGQRCSLDQKTSWLSAVDECKWAMIKCDDSGYVTEISACK